MANWTPKGRDTDYSYQSEPEITSVQHKHTAADTTTGPPAQIYPGVVTDDETLGAINGQAMASRGLQDPEAFQPSAGMHAVGHDHIDVFARSILFSGGVRQGTQFTSDTAPGVASANVDGNDAYDDIDVQDQGEGETFEQRQHSRWAGQGG